MNALARAYPAEKAAPSPASPHGFAFVTASYAPDFERCRLLCETMDRHVDRLTHHYILVEHNDVALFKALEGPKRTIIDERDLLPSWLKSLRDPSSLFRRRIWLSSRTKPLRGWHVQQLRRIAIAAHVGEDTLVYCDSDVVFVRPFDCGVLWRDGRARLFRRDGALAQPGLDDQRLWSAMAGHALGIQPPGHSPHDYISTVIGWRRDAVLGMCERIEALAGRHWVEAVASSRHYSECMLYGRYADEVLLGDGHFHVATELCRVYWDGPAMDDRAFAEFVETMSDDQVAIGMQSFIGTDIGRIRRLIGA